MTDEIVNKAQSRKITSEIAPQQKEVRSSSDRLKVTPDSLLIPPPSSLILAIRCSLLANQTTPEAISR